MLQWGRDLSIAELSVGPSRSRCTSRFNGAAIYRSRNCLDQRHGVLRIIDASMGPRSIDRGIESAAASRASDSAALQWGRDLSIAELVEITGAMNAAIFASMGPRSIDRGIPATIGAAARRHHASMGPRSIDRGISPKPRKRLPRRPASMGPRSIDRGIQPHE